jgi:hypothetical protein
MGETYFAQILDHCIDRMARGEGIELCLRDHPGEAAELGPLLRVALMTCQAAAVDPRPEFKARARSQLRSVLYGRDLKAEPRVVPLIDRSKSGIAGWVEGLRAWPVFQKALAGAVAVAIVVGLCLGIPAMLGQSSVALAKELAMEDPGVQILLTENGFDPSRIRAVAVESGGENIFLVHLAGPGDNALVGTVTVDVHQRMVARIGLVVSSEEYVQPMMPIAPAVMERIMEGVRGDASVRELVDAGAEVGRTSLFSPLSSPEEQMVGLELRLGEKSWLLKMDPGTGQVMSMLGRQKGRP